MRPAYYKDYIENPRGGIRVALGPQAWEFAKKQYNPTMVLPEDEIPSDRDWPSDGQPALIYERGEYNDERLDSLAHALLKAGANSVVAIREALMGEYDPRVFYDKEVVRVAA